MSCSHNRNYIRGRAHEYAIKKKWEKDGWMVIRSAGSHSEFDLVAIDPKASCVVLIQTKSGRSAERERAKLEPLKVKYEGLYSVRVEIL